MFGLEFPEWMERATCAQVGGDAWFPDGGQGHGKQYKIARQICRECPVKKQCLDYAMADPELLGIWSDTNEDERAALRKETAA